MHLQLALQSIVIQTGIQKSNLNRNRLTVIVKTKAHTHSRLSLILIRFKGQTSPASPRPPQYSNCNLFIDG